MTTELPIDDERLSAYLDGELSAVERLELEARLAREPQFQQAVDELRAMGAWVRALPRFSLGDDFVEQVQGRLESDQVTPTVPAKGGHRSLLVSGILALAASLLLLLMVPGFLRDAQVAQQSRLGAEKRGDTADALYAKPAEAETRTIRAEPESEDMSIRSFRDAPGANVAQPPAPTSAGIPTVSTTDGSLMDTSGQDQQRSANSADQDGNRVVAVPSARMSPTNESSPMLAPAAPRMPAALQALKTKPITSPAKLDRVRQRLADLGVRVVSASWDDRQRERLSNDRFAGAAGVESPPATFPEAGDLILLEGSPQQLRHIARQLKQLGEGLIINELPEEALDARGQRWRQPSRLREQSAAPTATFLGRANASNEASLFSESVAGANVNDGANRRDLDQLGRVRDLAGEADKDDEAAASSELEDNKADDSEEGVLAGVRLLILVPTSPDTDDTAKPE